MNRGVKIAATGSVIVAVIAVSVAVSSQALAPPNPGAPVTVSGFTVAPNHVNQTITASWNQASNHPVLGSVLGYTVWYWPDGNKNSATVVTVSGASATTYTHSNPTVGQKYWYQVAANVGNAGTGIPHTPTDAASATVKELPSVSSGTFDESTNTVKLTASQSIKAATAANVCINNTLGFNGTDGSITYETFDRCGSSASVSGTTVTVTISGEYSVNATMTSETIYINANAIQNTDDLWNAVAQDIVLTGGQ